MYLPAALKKRLRATSQWQAISLQQPQETIRVRLVTADREFDVTGNNVIAALKPLTISIGLDARMRSAVELGSLPELHLVDENFKRPIGVLRLHHLRHWNAADALLGMFEVLHGTHRCTPWPRRTWDGWMYRRAARRNTRPDSLALTPSAVEQTMVFYLRPRPVYLVSVDDGEHSNIFPMDLVGPVVPERFTLALRNTSPSVETIRRTRKVALSSVPAGDCQIAYQLGAHHNKITIDRESLPFKLSRSKEFSLPIPITALRVRELDILDFQSIGSHTLFVGRIVSDDSMRSGPQMFHTCGVHQQLRIRHKRGFEVPGAKSDR
jgi:flavin reductase (DIM6/NTAB) family NADH-FMN oxidoreductase RutF